MRCAAPGRFLQGGPLVGSERINRDAKRKAFSLTHSGTSTYGLVLDFKRLLSLKTGFCDRGYIFIFDGRRLQAFFQ